MEMSTPRRMKDEAPGTTPGIPAPYLEAVRDFISTAVHDLREPLRAIRLGSRLLAEGGSPSAENTAAGARYVVGGGYCMETLIRDIAEYCYEEVRTPSFTEIDL